MSFYYSYMGTKRSIASTIALRMEELQPGPLLDLFAGMSAVGAAVMPKRQVWCNDVQHYAHQVAQSLFVDGRGAPFENYKDALTEEFDKQLKYLKARLSALVALEQSALNGPSLTVLAELERLIASSRMDGVLARLRDQGKKGGARARYSVITACYGGGYFSLLQAAEIDAARCAVEALWKEAVIGEIERRRLLVAMGRAMASVSNSTGHFAQYLTIKADNLKRCLQTRRRSFFKEWISAIGLIQPHQTADFRRRNRAIQSDALSLLSTLRDRRTRPAVIYADPPYTSDQYSRYYHVLETLILYDFPDVKGKGMYRDDRYASEFSTNTKVERSFKALIRDAAEIGADLVISYPEKGLLETPLESIPDFLRDHFARIEPVTEIPHLHSTLGASKGVQKAVVKEFVFIGRLR
ncbi:MAG: DNA adenine methylase [Ignavibacteriales bacterium]